MYTALVSVGTICEINYLGQYLLSPLSTSVFLSNGALVYQHIKREPLTRLKFLITELLVTEPVLTSTNFLSEATVS